MSLTLGLILDALLGEPRWAWSRVPHPAVLMGRIVDWFDRNWNAGAGKRLKGAAAMAAMAAGALLLGWALGRLPDPIAMVIEVLVLAALLAQRSLADHVSDVARALRHSLPDGRDAVARIVGRDSTAMDGTDVARAAIESAAENLSDGVVAPVFWFLILGLPGLLLYKITNTADSMIGYRTPRHEAFGWAAARFDDALNWIPARLTGCLIALVHGSRSAWEVMVADAGKHRSPNAGWPEAAMAGALGVSLSGPRSYDGRRIEYPFVNPQGRKNLAPSDIDAAVRTLWLVWAALLALATLVWLIW